MLWHGGGFCLGDCDNEVALCRRWIALGGIAVNVAYRLAPEYLYPKAVEDAHDSLLWVRLRLSFPNFDPLFTYYHLDKCPPRRTRNQPTERLHRRRDQRRREPRCCRGTSVP